MLTVIADGFALGGVNYQRPGVAELFLQAGVAVVPVGTVLTDGKTVGKGFTRGDTCKANARHTIHFRR